MIYGARPFEEHEEGQEGDRQGSDHSGHDARQDLDSRARQTRDPTRARLVDRLLEPLDYLIVTLEKTEADPDPLSGRRRFQAEHRLTLAPGRRAAE